MSLVQLQTTSGKVAVNPRYVVRVAPDDGDEPSRTIVWLDGGATGHILTIIGRFQDICWQLRGDGS